jgi:hypothetical protein
MRNILNLGADMKLLLDSKMVYEECLLDFLPNMADPNTQVIYINNKVLKTIFEKEESASDKVVSEENGK